MPQVLINYTAVLVAGVARMVVGFLWYSPVLFGNAWMKLSGSTPEKIAEAKKKGMGKTYAMMFVLSLVSTYVLAHVIRYAGGISALDGMKAGFWVWLGFIATTTAGSVLFENKPVKLYLLNNGHELVGLLVAGAILAVWR